MTKYPQTVPRSARPAMTESRPLSRPLIAASVPPGGLDQIVTASPQECAALAAANGLAAVHALEGRLRVVPRGTGLLVTGAVRARVRQTCVVTLEEFDSAFEEPVELRFAPDAAPQEAPARRRPREDAPPVDEFSAEDPPEPLEDGAVDLGAICAEFLALGLDPWPRKPGAEFSDPEPAPKPEETSPFAGLRDAVAKPGEP